MQLTKEQVEQLSNFFNTQTYLPKEIHAISAHLKENSNSFTPVKESLLKKIKNICQELIA